jgi:hypothetical protein
MTGAALAQLVRDAHRRIALSRIEADYRAALRATLARVMRKDGWRA